jgi:hypothetical protein
VFALKIDRLGRSSHALGRLWAVCKDSGTRVVTTEGDFTDDDPATFLMRHTFEGFAVYYLKDQKRKSAKTKAYTDARGDDYGREPFGYARRTPKRDGTERVIVERADPSAIQRVLDAYGEIGTFLGAAKLLNAAGMPTARPQDGSNVQWHASTVRRVVEREAPEMVPTSIRRGVRKQARPRLFAGLLRCPCGTTLTPGGIKRKPVYYCWRAKAEETHVAKTNISENRLRPWITEEADRLVDRDDYYREGGEWDDPKKRALIEAARAAGMDDDADRFQAQYDAVAAEHGARERIALNVPDRIDWERWDTEGINRALRSLWEFVELGPDLLPVRAEWRIEEWRA